MVINLSSQILLKGVQSPESFTGADEQDPIIWLQDIEQMFKAASVRSEGSGIFDNNYNYDGFKQQLIKAFTSASQQLKISNKLVNQRQGLNESVQSKYYDVLSLCTIFNPDMSENEKVLHLLCEFLILSRIFGDMYI
ncbi:unnamed protein product [Didymodactylos carnosus]|uniref:Uncharacterized protein n=1 Tax=Didymodactylos carnosus TaxID=1234261 RepID=A0A815WP97_9BILA|nr:unnamed protein product [Didymodactylos carnosus]CAF4408755.1 unnamed protein product [Didymodactylos carnosus]